jgi:hypothetical protein
MINYAALTATIYKRLKLDPEGAAVRAMLGSGADSIITARQLSRSNLPARPLLALKRQPSGSATGGALTPIAYRWYIYDDPADSDRRIEQLISAIGSAYPTRGSSAPALSLPGHQIGTIEILPGPQAIDAPLAPLLYSYAEIVAYVAGPR